VSSSDAGSSAAEVWEPPRPALVAAAVFVLAAMTLCWPMLLGQFLVSPASDQYGAGYAFRSFGAEYFRAHHQIPEWNPYLFGGLPFIAAQHGDVFYPTAWLRWFMPVDTAMNLGFALHIVLAGCTMYALLRALRTGWTGALVGGLGYELSGIVASLVKPGHDGKLFVSALAPLALLAILRAVRDRRWSGYGLLALTVGLCMLSPHYQMTYYLLVACGIWTLWLALWDPARPEYLRRRGPAWGAIGLSFGAVLLGLAIAAIQIVPFLAYVPYSPRGSGGPSTGWEYATAFSMPPEEIVTTILPQFNGVLQSYWGRNFFKLHTEFLGAAIVLLAGLGWGDRARRPLLWVTGAIGALFLLISFGGHTPFYRLWYEVMPMMKKVRAPGMAFFLVALVVAMWAAWGADRLLRRDVPRRTLLIGLGILGAIGLLGATGGLEPIATVLAQAEQTDRVLANAGALQVGSLRLLVFVGLMAAVTLPVVAGRLKPFAGSAALAVLVAADLWSIDRLFFQFSPPAAELFRDDPIISRLRQEKPPFRVLDIGVYPGSYLMADDVAQVLGHHGNEVRFYDELLGGKNVWKNVGSPAVLDLTATQFLILPGEQELPGFHKVVGPVQTTPGGPGVLYQRDSTVPYARILPAAVRVPEDQIVPALIDPRFPHDRVALYPDTARVQVEAIRPGQPPAAAAVLASVTQWEPGRMRIALKGSEPKPVFLLVSENWYPDWHATVDGNPVPVRRGDFSFLSVALPSGAREVRLEFGSADYRRGRIITWLALLLTAGLLVGPAIRNRGWRAGG
jgi:hypothetical protein